MNMILDSQDKGKVKNKPGSKTQKEHDKREKAGEWDMG